MLKETIRELVFPRLGKLKSTASSKGWQTRDCMLCVHRGHSVDTRGRFGIMLDIDGGIHVHCFNCAFKASYIPKRLLPKKFIWFLEVIGVSSHDIKKLKFQAFREKEAGEVFGKMSLHGDARSKWKPCELPKDSYPIMFWLENDLNDDNFLKVAEYCVHRGVDVNDAYWSPDTKWAINRRMILPFRYNGDIVGYVGRYASDTPPEGLVKYYGVDPESFVYNLDMQTNRYPFIILTEGVLDAYFVHGVASLGEINKEQIDIINSFNKRVIVCPDRDKSGKSLVDAAIANGWEVSFPNWANDVKDVGKAVQCYGRLLTLQSILISTIENPTKIMVKRRLDSYGK